MSLPACPIQDVCPFYVNDNPAHLSHYYRTHHVCGKFIDMTCDMGCQLQVFLTGLPIACSIPKIQRVKDLLGKEVNV